MPIAFFEAGDSAVKNFTSNYARPKQNSPELMRVGGLDEEQRTYELAERAYDYNPRYPVAMATKLIYGATSEVEKALTDSTVTEVGMLLGDAKTTLKKSEGFIKEQKKTIPVEYSTLKKNNQSKNQDAKQYIRQIKADEKRLVGQSKKYNKSTIAKNSKIKKKTALARKRRHGLSPQKIQNVEPAKIQKKKDAPELLVMDDTITARTGQLEELKPKIAAQKGKLETRMNENSARLDSFAALNHEGDSLLVKETISRMKMHGSRNDEVVLLSSKYKEVKYTKVDTLQKYYLVFFDSIVTDFNMLQKMQVAEMDIYKKTLRILEQYKKWNSDNTTIDAEYEKWAQEYIDCIETFNSGLSGYADYLRRNKKLFSGLQKEGRRQIKVTEYMSKAEDLRSKMENHEISARQKLDQYENAKQATAVKNIERKVQDVVNRIN